jgi:zinc protease
MISYEYFTLPNGLQVYVHQDKTTPIAAFNLLYNVGAKDEDEQKTGFAHLFEHLMFGGSKNIASYDAPLQIVGGENNAFTNNDYTNYYITLPVDNLETAFWLESDRMLELSFDPKVLETQQKVVIEEFKQRYLNQPYGDVWLKLRPLAYQKHPYKWATIGKEISHIENATMEDVKAFFYKFYRPNNAVLTVAGNVNVEQIEKLAKKWFGDIPAGEKYQRNLPQEPTQTQARFTEISAKVPLDAIYKAYKMPERLHPDYQSIDLLSDVLGRGKSARLYAALVKEQKLFNSVSAYVMGSVEEGLFVVQGNLNKGISIEEGDKAIQMELQNISQNKIPELELQKVQNKALSSHLFGEMELLNRAMNISCFANLGKMELLNNEMETMQAVNVADIQSVAQNTLSEHKCSTLYYRAEN